MMKTTIFSEVCQKAGRDTFKRGTRTHTDTNMLTAHIKRRGREAQSSNSLMISY